MTERPKAHGRYTLTDQFYPARLYLSTLATGFPVWARIRPNGWVDVRYRGEGPEGATDVSYPCHAVDALAWEEETDA